MKHLPTQFNLQIYKKSFGEDTGVSHFNSGKNYIILKFLQPTVDGRQVYLYNYDMPGKKHVENMKKLAEEGKGLSGYLNQFVRKNFYAFWNEGNHQWELNNE
jgi:hypothetical protein